MHLRGFYSTTFSNIWSLCIILILGSPVGRILSGGWSSLMYACDYGDSGLVNLLLKNGADTKTQIGNKYYHQSLMRE